MICYITDSNGQVVAQFDGRDLKAKDGHTKQEVESLSDLPGVDQWDDDYLLA